MSILNSILKTFVGDKTKKDLSKITPLISKINGYQKSFESLSHDQLRKKNI
jgi:preprotein translocase subunit SecA